MSRASKYTAAIISAALGLAVLAPATAQAVTTSSITSNFNGTAIGGDNYIWFVAHLKNVKEDGSGLGSLASPTSVNLYVRNSFINFTAGANSYHLAVPDANLLFSSAVTSPSGVFDNVNKVWNLSYSTANANSDPFLTGLAFQAPASGLPGGIKSVEWIGDFYSDTEDVSSQWQWSAAVYDNFNANQSLLNVQLVDGSGRQSGTPGLFTGDVLGGARGGGGSNFTGSESSTKSFTVDPPGPPGGTTTGGTTTGGTTTGGSTTGGTTTGGSTTGGTTTGGTTTGGTTTGGSTTGGTTTGGSTTGIVIVSDTTTSGTDITGGLTTGGTETTGGTTTGGTTSGGETTGTETTGGAATTGGTETTGGGTTTGDVTTGGAETTGGTESTGGVTTGGAETTGGTESTGGVTTGEATTGGTETTTGGATTGDETTGGAGTTGNDGSVSITTGNDDSYGDSTGNNDGNPPPGVPEPTTLLLGALGAGAALLALRRKA